MGQAYRMRNAIEALTPEESLGWLEPGDALDYTYAAIEAGIPREGIQTVLRLLRESIPLALTKEPEADRTDMERAWIANNQDAFKLINETED